MELDVAVIGSHASLLDEHEYGVILHEKLLVSDVSTASRHGCILGELERIDVAYSVRLSST